MTSPILVSFLTVAQKTRQGGTKWLIGMVRAYSKSYYGIDNSSSTQKTAITGWWYICWGHHQLFVNLSEGFVTLVSAANILKSLQSFFKQQTLFPFVSSSLQFCLQIQWTEKKCWEQFKSRPNTRLGVTLLAISERGLTVIIINIVHE